MRPSHHLKRWLVPHKHNDHRPHLIRAHGLAVMASLLVAIQIVAFVSVPVTAKPGAPSGAVLAYASNITPTDLFAQTNQQRAANGLAPLRFDARLNNSANLKAQNMFAENYWAHVSPSGIQPWYWFGQAGYTYQYAGENLAKDFDTTSGAVTGWMNSPGHRANILNPNYTDVGFAVMNGTLTGGQTTLVVAHYGSVASTVVSAVVPATPKAATPPAPKPVQAAIPTPVGAPSVAQTPVATPGPKPASTPGISPRVVPQGQVSAIAPTARSYSLFQPLALTRTLTPATMVTLLLLTILLLVYLFTHLAVWRKGLKRWRVGHYRLYAAAQLSGLALAIVALASSGFGQVG